MTDQTKIEDAPVASGDRWTRRKATTILVAAWAALGLVGLAVMAGTLRIAGSVFEGVPCEHQVVLPVAATIGLSFFFWGGVAAISASMQPKDDEIDYSEFHVAPVGVRVFGLAIILIAGLASVPLAQQAGVHAAVALVGPMAMMFGAVAINALLGPSIRRRCPELWAEALARVKPREKVTIPTGKLRTIGGVMAILALVLGTALFVFMAACLD